MLIILSIIILVFPPKFGNQFYGIRTNQTLLSEATWAKGQKLFAISILGIGFIFSILGSFKLPGKNPKYCNVFITSYTLVTVKIYCS